MYRVLEQAQLPERLKDVPGVFAKKKCKYSAAMKISDGLGGTARSLLNTLKSSL